MSNSCPSGENGNFFPMNISNYVITETNTTSGEQDIAFPLQLCGGNNENTDGSKVTNAYNKPYPSCNLQYSYRPSTCICTYYENYLSFAYDRYTDMAPVLFNNKYYVVDEIRIYSPGIHTYGKQNISTANNPPNGEMIIIHTYTGDVNSDTPTTNKLLICIPMYTQNNLPFFTNVGNENTQVSWPSNNTKQTYLENLISQATQQKPDNGEGPSTLDVEFNLMYFVPNDQYFFYQSPVTWDSCDNKYDIIVTKNSRGYLPLTDEAFNNLSAMLPNSSYINPYLLPSSIGNGGTTNSSIWLLGGSNASWNSSTPVVEIFPNQKYNTNVTESFLSQNYSLDINKQNCKEYKISIVNILLVGLGISTGVYFLYEITKEIRNKKK